MSQNFRSRKVNTHPKIPEIDLDFLECPPPPPVKYLLPSEPFYFFNRLNLLMYTLMRPLALP